jgi:hypothetical protein
MGKVEQDFNAAAQASAADRQRAGLAPEPTNPPGSHSPDRVVLAMDSIADYYQPGNEKASPPADAPTEPTEHDTDSNEGGVTWP